MLLQSSLHYINTAISFIYKCNVFSRGKDRLEAQGWKCSDVHMCASFVYV